MTRRDYLILFTLALGLTSLVALFQHAPGYMDADYYYAGGLRLVQGYGFSEVVLWNYLDNPGGLPHPSHAYWMPMASLVAALGMFLARSTQFWAARIGFILIAGGIAPGTAALAYQLTGRREHAWLAGLLAAIPGFYLSYLATTDTFGVLMLLGIAWFMAIGRLQRPAATHGQTRLVCSFLVLGLTTGLIHLSRADGLSWLLVGILWIAISWRITHEEGNYQNTPSIGRNRKAGIATLVFLLGYLLVMGPWFTRNLALFGTPLSPGGNRALWFTDYDELFVYPPDVITLDRWLASGLDAIVQARWQAFTMNLQTALAVQGEIFLLPLIILGLWRWRKDYRVQLGMFSWVLVLGIMTVIFPYAGWRGGFFHSGAFFQPLFWAVAPAGLEVFIDWGRRVRRWNPRQASAVFRVGLLVLATMLAMLAVQRRVIGADFRNPAWNDGFNAHQRLELELKEAGADQADIVMVNNAPGYFVASQRPAISIPDGEIDTLLAVAKKYGAEYILLEQNHPQGLGDLYDSPREQPGLTYLFTFEGAHVFQVIR